MSEDTILVQEELKTSNRLENANVPMDEFDWEAHIATCPKTLRKPNTKIKAPKESTAPGNFGNCVPPNADPIIKIANTIKIFSMEYLCGAKIKH